MTKRSVILGLLGAAAICGLSYLNNAILGQTTLVGNNFPLSVFGGLIIFLICVNPLFGKLGLSGKELAVILAITLAGSAIPGAFRSLLPAMVMPHHFQNVNPGWKSEKIVDALPEKMLVDVPDAEAHDRVVLGYMRGKSERIKISDVPWRAWAKPLLVWLPLLATLWVALIGLATVVHRQWSIHERLPYPIARFTEGILPEESGQAPAFMRNRGFWIAAGIVLFIHLNNYAATWFPEVGIKIPTSFDFTPLGDLVPIFVKGGGQRLLYIRVYFVIIGMAFLIPKEASLSFGIGPFLWYFLMGVAANYGINLSAPEVGTGYFSLRPQSFALFGANLGVLLVILYTGRQFYMATARRAIGLRSKSEVDADSVSIFGLRVFLIAFALLIVQFMFAGIDLIVAVPYIFIMIIGFLVMGRVIAETGLIYMKCYFWPCAILWGVVGARTLGPQQLLIMMMITTMLFLDPREALLPFMTNSLQVLELKKVNLKKPAIWCIAALVVGVAVAVPSTLYLNYQHGSGVDGWATGSSKHTFNNGTQIRYRLKNAGVTVDEDRSTLTRLGNWHADWTCVGMLIAGLVLVLLFSFASLRLPKWPFHPLLFVTWASTPLRIMGASYLIGWAVKVTVVRFGGANVYNKLKPVMYGLIAGEIVGGVLPIVIGTLYFFITGDRPEPFRILPG